MSKVKRIAVFSMLLLLTVVLVACGNNDKKDLAKVVKGFKIEDILGDNESTTKITENVVLISKKDEVSISWASNNVDVIAANGKVTRPIDDDKDVKLTATFTLNKETDTKEFDLKVLKREVSSEPVTVIVEHTSGETLKFTESETDNQAALFGLDTDIFNVTANFQIGDYKNPIGLNKDGTIRLYANRMTGEGSDLKFKIAEGYVITDIEIVFAKGNNSPHTGLFRFGEETQALTSAELIEGTVSKTGLTVNAFSLFNNQKNPEEGAKTTQIWVKTFKITYKAV